MSAVLFDVAVTVSGSISPPPAVIPERLTVCRPESSGIGAGFGIAFSVGGSSTADTVSRNVSDAGSVVPPAVKDAVAVMVGGADRFGAGGTVRVRVEPLPVTVKLAFGTRVVSLDVAVSEIAVVPSPTLKGTTSGVSSGVV